MSYYNPQQYISIPHFDSPMKSDNFRTFSAMQEAWNRYQQEKRLEELHPLQVENYGLRNRNLTLDNELQEKLNPLKVKSEELLNVLRDKQNTKTQQEIDFDAENNPLLLENNRLKNIGQSIDNQYGNLKNANQRIQNEQAQWGFNNLQNEYKMINDVFGKPAAVRQAELLEQEAQARIETENANRDWYNAERDKVMMAQRAGDSQPNTDQSYNRNTLDVNNRPIDRTIIDKDGKNLLKFSDILEAKDLTNISQADIDAVTNRYASDIMDNPDGSEARKLISSKDEDLTPIRRKAKQQIMQGYDGATPYAIVKDPLTGVSVAFNPNADPNSSEGRKIAELKNRVNPLEYSAAIAKENLSTAPYVFNPRLKDNGVVNSFDPETGDFKEREIPNRGKGYNSDIRKLNEIEYGLQQSTDINIADKTANLLYHLKEANGDNFKKLIGTFNDPDHGNLSKKVFTNISLVLSTGKNGLNLKSSPEVTKLLYEICNNPEEFQSDKALREGLGRVFGNKDQAVVQQLEDVIQNTLKNYQGAKGNTLLTNAESIDLQDPSGKPLGVTMPRYNPAELQTEFRQMRESKYKINADKYEKRKNVTKDMYYLGKRVYNANGEYVYTGE